MKRLLQIGFIITLLGTFACKDGGVEVGDVDCSTVTYSGTIQPLIEMNCSAPSCHGAGSDRGDYTTYDLFLPNVQNGKVEKRVIQDQDMPVSGPLSSTELGQLQCWIDAGAPDN